MKLQLAIIFIVALLGMASASTVTLTGTCSSGIINSSNDHITFNITNSGNGTATELLLEPVIDGATVAPNNSTILIPLVAPGGTYSERVYMSNFTMPGSYVERFIARYSQGSSTFETIFPCLVDMGQGAHSLLSVAPTNRNGNVSVNITSIATYPINAIVSIYAPPEFTVSQQSKSTTVNNYGITRVYFNIKQPQISDAEFPIAVGVSYVNKSVHYSNVGITVAKFGGSSSGGLMQLGGSLIIPIAAAIISIIVVLIFLSIIVNRRKGIKANKVQQQNNNAPGRTNE